MTESYQPFFACLWLGLLFLSPEGVRPSFREKNGSAWEGLLFILVSSGGVPYDFFLDLLILLLGGPFFVWDEDGFPRFLFNSL